MGSRETVAIMKCITIVVILLIGPFLVASETKKKYPYPIESTGSEVCTTMFTNKTPCEWFTNDNFTELFMNQIKKDQEDGAEQGLFGVWFDYFAGCFPYCQNHGENQWITIE